MRTHVCFLIIAVMLLSVTAAMAQTATDPTTAATTPQITGGDKLEPYLSDLGKDKLAQVQLMVAMWKGMSPNQRDMFIRAILLQKTIELLQKAQNKLTTEAAKASPTP